MRRGAGLPLPLKYRFAPGHPLDGLTLTVPLALLNQVDPAPLSWLVPGMIREKLTWYLKGLPKVWRQRLTPLTDVVTALLEAQPDGAPARSPQSGEAADPPRELADALRAFCSKRLGAAIPIDVWEGAQMPAHLRVNLCVIDANGRELGSGRDLPALRTQLGEAAQLSFAAAGPEFERADIRTWDFGDLPESLVIERGGRKLTGFPALVDQGESVSLKLLDTRSAADASTRIALLRLLRRQFKDALQRLEKHPPGFAQAALMLKPAMPTDACWPMSWPQSAIAPSSAMIRFPDPKARTRSRSSGHGCACPRSPRARSACLPRSPLSTTISRNGSLRSPPPRLAWPSTCARNAMP